MNCPRLLSDESPILIRHSEAGVTTRLIDESGVGGSSGGGSAQAASSVSMIVMPDKRATRRLLTDVAQLSSLCLGRANPASASRARAKQFTKSGSKGLDQH